MVVNTRSQWLALACSATLMVVTIPFAVAQQTHFPSPDAAVQRLIEAAKADDSEALLAVLGPDAEDLGSGDPVADRAERQRFVEVAGEGTWIEQESADTALLIMGDDHWPFPIPLAKDTEGWRFDTAAGKDELLNRRIGRNELHAIATVRAIVDAQHEYAAEDPVGEGVRQYAQKVLSSEGKYDGLYWPMADGAPASPLGPLIAAAAKEGYQHSPESEPNAYHGYHFRILTAQGKNAPGGAKSYLKDGRMTEGFALVAYPAVYGNSGVMTFIANQQGIVFQKDLGEQTTQLADAISAYEPEPSWEPAVEP